MFERTHPLRETSKTFLFPIQPTCAMLLIFQPLLQNSTQYFPWHSLHCCRLWSSVIYCYCTLMSKCLYCLNVCIVLLWTCSFLKDKWSTYLYPELEHATPLDRGICPAGETTARRPNSSRWCWWTLTDVGLLIVSTRKRGGTRQPVAKGQGLASLACPTCSLTAKLTVRTGITWGMRPPPIRQYEGHP